MDYREHLFDEGAERWSHRIVADGTWHPNLFQFYMHVTQRLIADIGLPFQLGADLFRKGETTVHEAVREALTNALIHADYHGQGGVVIEKKHNSFEFSNPGTLLVSLEQLWRGGVSECRNKTLQTMFMLMGAAEKAGSGVDTICTGWAAQQWRSPTVEQIFRPDRVSWRLPMVSLMPQESLDRLKKCFGNEFLKFTANEVQALVTADLEKIVDNHRMRQICDMHASDVTQLLQGLVAKGALRQEGQRRWTRYRLAASDDSVHNGGDSVHNDEDLILIAAPARAKRRLSPVDMEALILKLCADRWLTRAQLASLLHRNSEGLRVRFLTPMVAHGRLRLRYPEKPNRGDQAYTSSDRETG